MKALMLAVAFVLVLALATVGAGCGSESEELSLEEYFRRLQTLVDEEEERSKPAESEFEEDLESATSLEELAAASQQFFSFALSDIEGFVRALQDLEPPAEVEEPHNEMIDGFEEVVGVTEDLINQLSDVESEAELTQLFNDYVSIFEPLEAPCVALEGIADDNGIQVDLDCEDVAND